MKNKSETLDNSSGFNKTLTVDKAKKTKKSKGRDQTSLLISIADYLQQKGFTKTFAKFKSEAGVSQLDNSKIYGLEEIFFKHLDSSECDTKSTDNAAELGVVNNVVAKENLEEPSVKTKKKKSKLDLDSSDAKVHDISTVNSVPASQLDESDRKSKDKKRKKSKATNMVNGGSETCSLEEKTEAEKPSSEIVLDEKNLKSKDKKKRKIPSDEIELDTKEDNTVNEDKKSSKKRKRVISEEIASQPDADEKKTTVASEVDTGKTEGGHASKKAKSVNDQADAEKLHETSLDKKLMSGEEKTPNAFESLPKEFNIGKSGREDTGPLKSRKKQQNGSTEPKTLNAFQRVKVDEVKFADDRLQDNSYWAKGGAEIGYGAKAQEVLGQVRGRDFRHEKTKKKRGSYRGGQIDLQTHSIKFNYDDSD
ncbi:hypothetical protein ACHQM5_030500 [Ranunculus cassubicifolius]